MAAGLWPMPTLIFVTHTDFSLNLKRVSTLSKWQPDSDKLHLILMALKINAEQ